MYNYYKYNSSSIHHLISVFVVVAQHAFADVHDILDLGLHLDSLANKDGVVQSHVASRLVGVVKVDKRSRDVLLALLEVTDLP